MDLPFTQDGLAKLAALTGVRVVVRDPKTVGLRAELREGGRITFYLFRRPPGGEPQRVRIGCYPEVTVKAARDAAADLIARMSKGENVSAARRRKREEPTLKALFDHWLLVKQARKKTWPEDKRMFDRYLADWHAHRLSTITKSDVRAWHAKLGADSGIYQANRALALLRSMFNEAEDAGYDGANPAARVARFPEVKRDRFLQPEELPAFFAAIASEPNETIRDFVLLAIFTGARRGDVLAMRWEHLSIERAEWRIPTPKQGKPQFVHLPAPAVAILRRRRDEYPNAEWVLPGHVRGHHLKDPAKNWKRILTTAGIENVRLHDLRRTLGSYMAIGGASLNIIGAALGHTQPSTTAVYARLTSNVVADGVRTAVGMIEEAGKGKSATDGEGG